jgi:hypothetical protein
MNKKKVNKPTDKNKKNKTVKKIDESKAKDIKGGHGGWSCAGSVRK